MNNTLFKKLLHVIFIMLMHTGTIFAANYYWRVSPVDNVYTNIANWETSPGGSISPGNAPTASDDVFFPAAINVARNINLNGGFCRDFNFNATAAFTFSGSFSINGSLLANGNAQFNIAGSSNNNSTTGNTLYFTGSGTHNIDMGTDAQRFTGLGGVFFISSTLGGTYNLINHDWNTANVLRFNTPNFNTNGKNITAYGLAIEGNTANTIDFSNSIITITFSQNQYSDNFIGLNFANRSCTFVSTGTRLIMNAGDNSQIVSNRLVTVQSVTLNTVRTSTLLTSALLTADTLFINTPRINFAAPGYGSLQNDVVLLNARVIKFVQSSEINNYANTTLGGVNTILEDISCRGQSSIQSLNSSMLRLNTTAAISTISLVYRGVQFGGSGVTASSSFDKGLNSGAITWSAPVTSAATFYWIGGNGSWSDPTKWSVAGSGGAAQLSTGCLPSILDDVVFDANSFSANQTVIITDKTAYCRNITFSDPNNEGALGGASALIINGNIDFTGLRSIVNTVYLMGSANHTITSGASLVYTNPTIQTGIGSYTLTNDMIGSLGFSTSFYHLSGTLNTNGKKLTTGTFTTRSLPLIPANVRYLDITNSEISHYDFIVGGGCFMDNSYLGSFSATGSHIKIMSNAQNSFNLITTVNTPGNFLAAINFNDVSFTSLTGIAKFATHFFTGTAVTYNNVHFSTDADITKNYPITHTVDSFWLTSAKTYNFTSNSTFNITGAIQHNTTACGEFVRINSTVSGSRALLYKVSLPFDINGVIVKDIHASGVTMTVVGGIDAGNNLNITVNPGIARNMYWVNGTGNWGDGARHWSIGVSGGDPTITNPAGCIPRLTDNVFFDGSSFNASGQTVTINIDGECKNMLWDANAGNNHPVLTGVNPRILNVYGTLEYAAGMTSPFSGDIIMRGSASPINSQSIKTNAVVLNNTLTFNGGGRYDLLDSISTTNSMSLNSGNFLSNGHKIMVRSLLLDVRSPNQATITNSTITVNGSSSLPGTTYGYSYYAYHSGAGNWDATNSTIQNNSQRVTINSSVPVAYHNVIMNPTTNPIFGNEFSTASVTINKVEWLTKTSLMNGNLSVDSLVYSASSTNRIQAARTITVNDTLVAYGTPCEPVKLQSAAANSQATLSSGSCNFDIRFGFIEDLLAGTCSASANKVFGSNGGNNANWIFTTIAGLSPLGNDTTINCVKDSITLSARGFGANVKSFIWSNGATTDTVRVTNSGTYWVKADYGTSCFASDTINISCSVPQLVITNPRLVCSPDTVDLTAPTITTGSSPTNIILSYWKDAMAINTLTDPHKITQSGTYFIVGANEAGLKDTAAVIVTIGITPAVSAGLDKSICQLDTIATVFVSGANAGGYTSLSWSTYNGTGTFANNSTANALTTTTYDPTTADHNAVPPGANLVLTAVSSDGCVASDTMRLNIRTTYTWTGATSEDFGTASNWQLGCVPPQYASINFAPDVVNICKLDQHRYLTNITNDSNANTAKNILNLNGKRLTVVGQLNYPTAQTTGKINAENALDTMEFGGVSPFYLSPANQVIPAHLFTNKTVSNLRFDNTAGVREQDSIFITHTLQPVNGTWNTAGQLTLRSTANLTARVTPIANTAATTINGNVIIERFIQSDTNRAWRILSACIQPATAPTIFQSWQENMRATTGVSYQPGYGTFVSRPGAGITNGYDSSSIATSLQYWDGMNLVTPMTTNTSTEKLTGHGGAWFLFVRGDKNLRPELYPAQSTTTLRQTGILNQGAVTAGQPGASYSLIPNPYASPVDLEAVGNVNNLNTFYIWDAKMNTIGGYRTLTKSGVNYIATPSTGNTADDDNLRYLQSGQGFMIPGNQQLNFTEAMKTGNNFTHSVYKIASVDPELETELYNVNNSITPQLVDGVRLYLEDSYSNQVVADEDVTKPENINENLAIGEGIQNLVISKRQEPTTADTVQLKFWKTALSSYEFAFKPHHIGSNLTVSLIDKYTNIVTPISTTTNTTYTFTITNATGSRDVNRFMITLNQNNPLRLAGIRLKAEKQAEGAKVTWSVASQKGVVQYEVERSADGKAFEKVQVVERKGGTEATTYTWIDVKEIQTKLYYRIKGTSADKDYVYSNIVQLSEGIKPGRAHIYPNPVTTQTLTLTLSDLAKGSYAMELYSELGQKVQVTTLNHQGGTSGYEVKLGNELATGNYMLKLMHGNKAVFTQKLVIMKQ